MIVFYKGTSICFFSQNSFYMGLVFAGDLPLIKVSPDFRYFEGISLNVDNWHLEAPAEVIVLCHFEI